MKIEPLKIILPWPVSVNRMFASSKARGGPRHRFKSRPYKEWLDKCPSLEGMKFLGKCTVMYLMHFPDNRLRDGQNYMKAPLDYIVNQGVLVDDDRRYLGGEAWIDCGTDKENPRIVMIIKEQI